MTNIFLVVIVYNLKLMKSDTLQSIRKCNLSGVKLKISIWNNGPKLLEKADIDEYLSLNELRNVEIDIYQDIRNVALSKIYNFFSRKENYDYITICDQDSIFPTDFFYKISIHSGPDLIIPRILAKKENLWIQNNPHEYDNAKIIINEGPVNIRVDSVMSGISISKEMIEKLLNFRGYAFEERLAFYGIDFDLFRAINLMLDRNIPVKTYCVNDVYHSFAFFDSEEAKSTFRQMEMFYFKFFIRNEYQKKSILSTLWICIRDYLRGKNSFEKTKNLIVFTLKDTHPRSLLEIEKNKKPTYKKTCIQNDIN